LIKIIQLEKLQAVHFIPFYFCINKIVDQLGGVKTSNGINRTVPIHPKVLPIIQKYYHEAIDIGRPMLFGRTQKFHGSFRYIENSFRNSLLKKESELGILGHVLHDGRHTS